MVFSSISIIVIIVSMITEKQILNSQGYAMVEFDVTGPTIAANTHQFRNKTKQIRNEISNKLGLHERLIEIIKPKKIPDGLRFTINIHLNRISARDKDYQKLLNEAQKNGSLGGIFQNSWNLTDKPNVSNIEFKVNESKSWIKGVVPILMDNQSPISKEQNNEIDGLSGNNVAKSLSDHLGNNERKMEGVGEIKNIELAPMPQINATKGEVDESGDSECNAVIPGGNDQMKENVVRIVAGNKINEENGAEYGDPHVTQKDEYESDSDSDDQFVDSIEL